MIRTQVQLTDDQFRALKTEAGSRGVSMAFLIREAVDRFAALSPAGVNRRARALESVGGFRSGRTDVSRRHDDELAEAFDD
jgi:hypothetical protein